MDISNVISISYFLIGLILAFYWFKHDYTEPYDAVVAEGEEEKGMTCIFLLFLVMLWPIKIFKNIIEKKRI